MSSTQAAGFGVPEALSSFIIRRSARAVDSLSRAWWIFWEKVHSSKAGSLAISITASPNAVIRSLVNKGMSSMVRC